MVQRAKALARHRSCGFRGVYRAPAVLLFAQGPTAEDPCIQLVLSSLVFTTRRFPWRATIASMTCN